jgi:DNA (cytosine-5)-methyltransferase 1
MSVNGQGTVFDHVSGQLSSLDEVVVEAVPPGGNWRDLPPDFDSKRIAQIRESAARGEGSRSTYYGRLRWDRPSYTISTYFNRPGNGCFIHPSAPRLISVREAARLQGFPDAFRFTGRGRSRYVQVGNAVPPLLAYQLARAYDAGTVVDLFSGAGGLGLGFEWAGFQLLAAVDHDRAANETLATNIGDADKVLNADLSDRDELRRVISEVNVRARRKNIRALVGGPPCQGFSTAGHCRLDDPRNRLVFAFLAAVEQLRPELVLFENVAALLWRGRRGFLDEVVARLRSLGYETAVSLIHAEGFGVPQLRRRVIVVASRTGEVRWPIPSHRVLDPASREAQIGSEQATDVAEATTVRDALSDLPDATTNSADDAAAYVGHAASAYQQWARGELPIDDLLPSPSFAETARLFAA